MVSDPWGFISAVLVQLSFLFFCHAEEEDVGGRREDFGDFVPEGA